METITLGIYQDDLRTVDINLVEDVSTFLNETEVWYLPKKVFQCHFSIEDLEEDEDLREELISDFINENWDEAYQFYLDNED